VTDDDDQAEPLLRQRKIIHIDMDAFSSSGTIRISAASRSLSAAPVSAAS
jgi:hypothetical protein